MYKNIISIACISLILLASMSANSAPDDPNVIAEVGNGCITNNDIEREIRNLPEYLKAMATTPQGRKEILDTMVIREMILQEASKLGIDKQPEIAEKLKDLRKRLIVESYLKSIVGDIRDISEEKLKKFYEQNKSKFEASEQIRVSHILVKDEKEAESILAQLKTGNSFDDLARKYSVDSSANKGGDLGWFGKGSMVSEFDEAAFALKDNQISNIVKTDFGYHIIKFVDKRPAGLRPYYEVKDQIIEAMMPSLQQEKFIEIKSKLKSKIHYKVYENRLNTR